MTKLDLKTGKLYLNSICIDATQIYKLEEDENVETFYDDGLYKKIVFKPMIVNDINTIFIVTLYYIIKNDHCTRVDVNLYAKFLDVFHQNLEAIVNTHSEENLKYLEHCYKLGHELFKDNPENLYEEFYRPNNDFGAYKINILSKNKVSGDGLCVDFDYMDPHYGRAISNPFRLNYKVKMGEYDDFDDFYEVFR